MPVGIYPYTTVTSADGSKVYVTNWGGKVPGPSDTTDGMFPVVVDPRTGIPITGTVSVLDTTSNTVVKTIDVGRHPTGMSLSPDGSRLYVTNGNSDTVSVISTATDAVVRTLHVGGPELWKETLLGASPNAVTVSPNGRTLYVANAAQNAIAVVDAFGDPRDPVRGLIPTGWYPTAVALDVTGEQLFVGSGYGFGSIAPTPPGQGRSYQDRVGVVSILDVPSARDLGRLTKQVRENNESLPPVVDKSFNDHDDHGDDARDRHYGDRDGRHDGRDDRGHSRDPIPLHLGDRSPIKHVFYIIKENRTYDQVFGDMPQGNGDPTLVEFGRDVTPNHHALAEQFALLDNYYGPGDQSALGHRWVLQAYPSTWVHKYGNGRNNQNPMLLGPTEAIYDSVKAAGLSARAYGERGANTITPSNATWTDFYNAGRTARTRLICKRGRSSSGCATSIIRATRPPRAAVADNDLALGRIVEAVSKSRYWKESAIFVTEDDSQDGLDHVDGHCTVGLVISPYTRHGIVERDFYTIVNMFRTIAQILGIPPQNHPAERDESPLAGLQGLQRELALFSMSMDSSAPDSAPADVLNLAIWHSVKGFDVPYNYGKPIKRIGVPWVSLPRLAGF